MKVKQWIKMHKREIVVGLLAAGGTAAYFLLKEKKVQGLSATLRLSLDLADKNDGEIFMPKSDVYTSLNIHEPSLAVGDLGKLGEELKLRLPNLEDNDKLCHLSVSYSARQK